MALITDRRLEALCFLQIETPSFDLMNLYCFEDCKYKLLSAILIYWVMADTAIAQVTQDGTLSTNVTSENNRNFVVNGGKQAGNNLFHSFEQFSVPTNGSVFFNNSLTIQNIISRVTGSSTSSIDGLIQNNGAANLFLINPNGIVFGENAVLNLGGSFVATTAESLIFADGNEFSTQYPSSPPLLTISTPLGLQFGDNPGSIVNRSQLLIPNPSDPTGTSQINLGLAVQPEKTLALLGGDILIDGGALTAPMGNIELGSVGGNSFIHFNAIANGWDVGYQDVSEFRDLQLDNLAIVNATGEGGGAIALQGRQIKILNGSAVVSETFGATDGKPITLNASELVEINGSDPTGENLNLGFASLGIFLPVSSRLASNTFGAGKGGDISINTPKLLLLDGAQIEIQTLVNPANPPMATGNSGNILIKATELVQLQGKKPLLGVTDNASELLPIPANNTDLVDSVSLNRFIDIGRSSSIDAASASNGKSGNINIFTNRLTVLDGAVIENVPFGSGDGGDIVIEASESVTIAGNSQSDNDFGGIIASNTFDAGNAGNINLTTTQLSLQDGGGITTSTLTSGKGGSITLNASKIEILGISGNGKIPSGFGSETFGAGDAGNLSVNTEQLNIRDRGQITVRGTSFGSPGNLEINANSIQLDNRAVITAATESGSGGNIKLDIAENLTLGDNSQISAQARGNADGGNVDISANFIIARPLENSDILASAVRGDGGNINITTQGIFGLSENNSQPANSTNDLDASSDLGLSGTVAIQIPQFDPARGIFEVPPEVIDLNSLLQNSFCKLSDNSSYITTGRGGIPLVPDGNILGSNTWEDWRVMGDGETERWGDIETGRHRDGERWKPASDVAYKLRGKPTETATPQDARESLPRQIERRGDREIETIGGWLVNRQGKVVLTANPLVVTPRPPQFNRPNCNSIGIRNSND